MSLSSCGINYQYFALIFQIVVDGPLPVGNGEFHPHAQINRAVIVIRVVNQLLTADG